MSKQSLPPIEKFWRSWRTQHIKDFKSALSLQKKWMIESGIDEFPSQIVVPGGVFTAMFPVQVYGNYWFDMTALAAYRATKNIFNVDPDLYENIKDLDWPAATPSTALLYLPSRCMVIPSISEDLCWIVFYDIMNRQEAGTNIKMELRVGQYVYGSDHIDYAGYFPILDGMSLNDSLNYLVNEGQFVVRDQAYGPGKQFKANTAIEKHLIREQHRQKMSGLINTLLYAAGNDDIVEIVGHEYPSIPKKIIRRNSDDKTFANDTRNPQEYSVGIRFGRAIKHYVEIQDISESSGETGRKVRPHVRRAHPHLYWTGKKREVPIVKYLPPIPVRGGKQKDEAEAVTVRKVL